ncbi:unnamed protein product [Arabidopsis thaliana]|uniref:(thale cress) hypothetical protein n=1 Tax=Arabidopsis thaliana TaxID=3702 RepID=A0A7G2FPS1_ARATH|nr:unnamed protein product [Arabidopsis thaliana]
MDSSSVSRPSSHSCLEMYWSSLSASEENCAVSGNF